MRVRDLKSTQKPAEKKETKKKASTKKGITSDPKPPKVAKRPAPPKAAAKTAKPGKKTSLKKPAAKQTSAAKKTGPGKKPSDEAKKLRRVSAVKKPAEKVKKPAGAKTSVPSKKSSPGKTGKIPAPAAAKPKSTGKKLQEPVSKKPAPKKIAAKVSSAPVKKTAMKGKKPSSKGIGAAAKTAKTVKKPSAAKVEIAPVRAKPLPLKTAGKSKKNVAAKAVAEKVVSSKLPAKRAKKPAVSRSPGEKEKKLSPKEKIAPARVAAKPAEEKKTRMPKAPIRKKIGAVVSGIAGAKDKTPVRKTEEAGTARIIPAKIPGKTTTALKRAPAKEAGAKLLPEKPERAKLKIFLPGTEAGEEDMREGFISGLPEEYGENALIAMAVDPNTIFVDWEVVPGEIAGKQGEMALRFYDVTGIEFDGGNAHAILDMRIMQRVGSGFFVIHMPGRDVVVEAGILGPEGSFHSVVRSDVVSFPFLLTFDDLGIMQGIFVSDIPVGY